MQQVGRQSWRSHGVLVSTPVPSHTHALGFEKITQILAVIERVRVWRLWGGAIVCVLAALTISVSSVATRSCMTILALSHL